MLSIDCCSLAYSGISWKGESGTPSFSMYMRCSRVLGAPIFLAVNFSVALGSYPPRVGRVAFAIVSGLLLLSSRCCEEREVEVEEK